MDEDFNYKNFEEFLKDSEIPEGDPIDPFLNGSTATQQKNPLHLMDFALSEVHAELEKHAKQHKMVPLKAWLTEPCVKPFWSNIRRYPEQAKVVKEVLEKYGQQNLLFHDNEGGPCWTCLPSPDKDAVLKAVKTGRKWIDKAIEDTRNRTQEFEAASNTFFRYDAGNRARILAQLQVFKKYLKEHHILYAEGAEKALKEQGIGNAFGYAIVDRNPMLGDFGAWTKESKSGWHGIYLMKQGLKQDENDLVITVIHEVSHLALGLEDLRHNKEWVYGREAAKYFCEKKGEEATGNAENFAYFVYWLN